jgi:polysaccharide biosynthesis transport protein
LLSGLLAPLAHEMWFNRRVRCRDDLELDFGMPVLAVLDRSNKQVSLS